jgi:hypothetical protein
MHCCGPLCETLRSHTSGSAGAVAGAGGKHPTRPQDIRVDSKTTAHVELRKVG